MQDEVEAEMEQVRGSLHRETRHTQELQDAVNRLQRENAQHQIHRAAPAKKKALEDRAVDANASINPELLPEDDREAWARARAWFTE